MNDALYAQMLSVGKELWTYLTVVDNDYPYRGGMYTVTTGIQSTYRPTNVGYDKSNDECRQ
jgi:hypothetical protein